MARSRLGNAWFVASTDVAHMLRQRETALWVFVMPFVFSYFIGTVTGGFGGPSGQRTEPLLLEVAQDAGFLAEHLEQRLAERGFAVARAAVDSEAPERRLAVPAGFTRSVLAGEQAQLAFTGDDDGLGGDYEALRVGRAVYSVLADLVAASELAGEVTPESLSALRDAPRALTLVVSAAGKRQPIPSGFEQTVPGTLVMFTLIVLLTSGAALVVIERREGLLRRLAAAPIGRGELVLGKWAGKLALGLVQIAFAMLIGRFVFDVHWGADLWMVCVILCGWAGLCASLGLLLGSLASSEGQAVGIGVLTANVLAALGGCWWPIEVTPGWMQGLALFLPTGWTMDALHQLVNFGNGARAALPHAVGLFAAMAIAGWGATRAFRYQ
jgi:ABC-type Na+ efflux pump permease subunit